MAVTPRLRIWSNRPEDGPFRTAASPALAALTRKRAELAGEALALERQLDRLQADLTHLDAAIRMLRPDARPELIKPKVPGRRGCG